MIFKSDLLDAINELAEQVMIQGHLIAKLENRLSALETKGVKKNKPGRPVGAKDKKPRVKKTNTAQPRDKSGKFAKK